MELAGATSLLSNRDRDLLALRSFFPRLAGPASYFLTTNAALPAGMRLRAEVDGRELAVTLVPADAAALELLGRRKVLLLPVVLGLRKEIGRIPQ